MIMLYEFSVQKEKLRYAKNGVRQREYVCSKEGFPRDGDRLDDKKFKRFQTMTGCEASIQKIKFFQIIIFQI